MKFYTSYYANKNIPDDYIKISISGGITEYIEEMIDKQDKRLAPKKGFFNVYKKSPEGKEREQAYVQSFKDEVLKDLDLNEIFLSWSKKFGKNKKFVLLCYEHPGDFCHRHIIAEAIEEKYGIEVQEIGFEDYSRKDNKMTLIGNLDNW